MQPWGQSDIAAFGASERARARSLLEILTEARADIRQGIEPLLLERGAVDATAAQYQIGTTYPLIQQKAR